MILTALKFAERKHRGQVRKVSGKPYVIHPIVASYMVVKYKKSKHLEELIVALLLHDTLEDTTATFAEIAKMFGPLVAGIVFEMTSDEAEIKKLGKNEYFKKKMCGMSSYALICKLVDRYCNIKDSPKIEYVYDTITLISHLQCNRKLTKSHKGICKDILEECSSIIERTPIAN
jgi:(p)ppGpp synthase/HD superfamily hydrolase